MRKQILKTFIEPETGDDYVTTAPIEMYLYVQDGVYTVEIAAEHLEGLRRYSFDNLHAAFTGFSVLVSEYTTLKFKELLA